MKSKIANRNGSRLIMYLMAGMVSGLKILVSAVQSRPCPPLLSTSCPPVNFPRSKFVPRFVPISSTLERPTKPSGASGASEAPTDFCSADLPLHFGARAHTPVSRNWGQTKPITVENSSGPTTCCVLGPPCRVLRAYRS